MLTKEDIAPILERFNREALETYEQGAPGRGFIVRVTSGTTGAGPLLRVGRFPRNIRRFKGSRRILALAGSRNVRLANVRYALDNDDDRGEAVLALDAADVHLPLAPLLNDFRPDCIVGVPSFIRAIIEIVGHEPLQNVENLFLFGEMHSEHVRKEFARLFPRARISTEYLNSEVGKMGDYCEHLPANQYHPWRDTVIEIHAQSGSEVGELLVSRAIAPSVFIERYRTGDAGRMIVAPCPCGNRVTFEVLGRIGYDYLKAGGAQLRVEEFDRVASELELYVTDFRAEVREHGSRWLVRLHVIPRGTLLSDPEIRELFRSEFEKRLFVTPTRTLAELVGEGLFLPLELSLANRPFPLDRKSVKLRLAHD